jgi:CheY-like chemotaxis protein
MDNSFLHSKKLLLVDDKPELLKMVSAILADEGFQRLVIAANMKAGIAAAKAEKPDLAILDVILSDGDGFALMEQILAFALTFGGIVFREYGSASPANMLEAVTADLSASGISEERSQELSSP